MAVNDKEDALARRMQVAQRYVDAVFEHEPDVNSDTPKAVADARADLEAAKFLELGRIADALTTLADLYGARP